MGTQTGDMTAGAGPASVRDPAVEELIRVSEALNADCQFEAADRTVIEGMRSRPDDVRTAQQYALLALQRGDWREAVRVPKGFDTPIQTTRRVIGAVLRRRSSCCTLEKPWSCSGSRRGAFRRKAGPMSTQRTSRNCRRISRWPSAAGSSSANAIRRNPPGGASGLFPGCTPGGSRPQRRCSWRRSDAFRMSQESTAFGR